MDGTLTEAHIDFADMRRRTGIPVGDLFVAMESWEDPKRIKTSMDIILDIEADAAARVSAKEGWQELLALLAESDVKVALVTRNTNASVAAFFSLIGPEAASLFSEVRTREFQYVKPDKRLLLDVAAAWQLRPGCLLMVGDSFEDVEVGNAVGAATALVAGGGNEAPGSNLGPPPGAVPTLTVRGLGELAGVLRSTARAADGAPAAANASLLGWGAELTIDAASGLDPCSPGAPAQGLAFVDDLVEAGDLRPASSSFPRMGSAAGGLAACPRGGGDTVLHVGCERGALTKMLASRGLSVVGVDADISAAVSRGLRVVEYSGAPLAPGSLAGAGVAAQGGYDVVLVYQAPGGSVESCSIGGGGGSGDGSQDGGLDSASLFSVGVLAELASVLAAGGRVCAEVPVAAAGSGPGAVADLAAAEAAGLVLRRVTNLPGRIRVVLSRR